MTQSAFERLRTELDAADVYEVNALVFETDGEAALVHGLPGRVLRGTALPH